MQLKKVVLSSVCICLLFFSVEKVFAKDIVIGGLKVLVDALVEERYDSNVFLDSTNEKSSAVTQERLNLKLEKMFGENSKFDASAGMILEQYADYSDQNMETFYISTDLLLDTRNFYINVSEFWQNTKDLPDTEITGRARRYNNVAKASIKTKGQEWSFELKGENIDNDYVADGNSDRDINEGEYGVVARYKMWANGNILLEYDYGVGNYSRSVYSDSDYNQVLIGVESKLWDKSIFVCKLGYQDRDYDQAGVVDPEDAVAKIKLKHVLGNEDKFNLSYERSIENSVYNAVNFYRRNSVIAGYEHDFNEKLALNIFSAYDLNKYPINTIELGQAKKRKDATVRGGLELKYQFPQLDWLQVSLKHEYKERASNHDNFDYIDNVTSLRFNIDL